MVISCTRPGLRISSRKRFCWSNSSARRVGPGWLQANIQPQALLATGTACSLEILGVCGLLEVLQIIQVGNEFRPVERLLLGQVIEIGGIREALHKLGRVREEGLGDGQWNGPQVQVRSENTRRRGGRLVTRTQTQTWPWRQLAGGGEGKGASAACRPATQCPRARLRCVGIGLRLLRTSGSSFRCCGGGDYPNLAD